MTRNSALSPRIRTPSNPFIEAAGREMKANPPKILARTRAKKGAEAAERQRVAILLSKARQAQR